MSIALKKDLGQRTDGKEMYEMVREEACYMCGEWFVKRGNQRYCCVECRNLAEKKNEERYRENEKMKQKKKQN